MTASSSTENFKLSIESIYGIKTPNLIFDTLNEQFYQDDELIPVCIAKSTDSNIINGEEIILDYIDEIIKVNTPEGIKIFPSKLFPYWETECYLTERDTYAIRKLTESEERDFLGVNYGDD
jgi:hypothetical protein